MSKHTSVMIEINEHTNPTILTISSSFHTNVRKDRLETIPTEQVC